MQLPGSTDVHACGIVYPVSEANIRELHLPLEQAEVYAEVVDVSALVTVTQQFWQHSPTALARAKYVFPVPARAAVCAFAMIAEDGTVIVATAKEKEDARREYEAAIRQGAMAGLVEHVADDVFSISLGAVPGPQLLTTKITYVLDLTDDDAPEQVRLQLPMSIGARFGTPPADFINAAQIPPHRVSISIDVRMSGAVKRISSPTHPTIILGPLNSEKAPAIARYLSHDFLTQDFVLCIQAEGLDAPRCFAQRTADGVVAVQLNIVPKFNLPRMPSQEYIFLVDRSGSMCGPRLETAQRALVMLLRSLPMNGTWFNIMSFGDRCDGLWLQSAQYGEGTLQLATEYVDDMDANYGGTEIGTALGIVFSRRKHDMPTAVFVLTDGESYATDQTLDTVAAAVKGAKSNAPLRVFTLGIGETTSSEMCEGIARVGNGLCLMTSTAESVVGKCSRLVRASRTYILKNVSVDWGVRTDLAGIYRSTSTDLQGVRQAPATIDTLYPGTRSIVFALVDDKDFVPPREVVIRAQRDGYGEVLQFRVPVQEIPVDSDHTPPLIPTLAARRAIMDIEDKERICPSLETKALIVRLGTQYQLASRYTSFVAVDNRANTMLADKGYRAVNVEETAHGDDEDEYVVARMLRDGRLARLAVCNANSPLPPNTAIGLSQPRSAPDAVQYPGPFSLTGSSSAAHPRPPANMLTVGCGMQTFQSRRASSTHLAPRAVGAPPPPPPPVAARPPAVLTPPPPPPAPLAPSAPPPSLRAALALSLLSRQRALDDATLSTDDGWSVDPLSTADDVTLALVRLQAFDGSFPPTSALEALIMPGCALHDEDVHAKGVSGRVWATVLAIVCLKRCMRGQPELLDGLVEKAMDYLECTGEDDLDALFARAESVLLDERIT